MKTVILKKSYENCYTLQIKIGADRVDNFVNSVCLHLTLTLLCPSKNDTGLSKRFKDLIFLIPVVQDVKENYMNVKKVLRSLRLQKLGRKFKIATDLKLCNAILGMMSPKYSHSCC